MISIRFEEKQQIGLQYALETLHGCSPFGQEKIRRLRFYTPAERAELEEELYNVKQAADHAEELKGVYDKICILLCQMKARKRRTFLREQSEESPSGEPCSLPLWRFCLRRCFRLSIRARQTF